MGASNMAAIIQHPIAFVDNLRRMIAIMRGTCKTVDVQPAGQNITVKMRRPLDPEGPFFPLIPLARYPGFKPHSEVLPEGHRRYPYNRALPCNILLEQDFTVPMRDGVKLYCDIYRPAPRVDAQEVKAPIILVWAPYGKHGNSELFHNELPERLGVKKSDYSGYENFEGPDPAYWVQKGYAVVSIDVRGSWNSEGNMSFWGQTDIQDGYDTVEFLAHLPWCNGKVGMAGNSWLAISQWFIASGNPPSLAAIAPWEGSNDAYRDNARRGGVANGPMSNSVAMLCPGRGLQEDHAIMARDNEFYNQYWEDKRVKLGKVNCPAYVLASYTSKLHAAGSVRGFNEIASKNKWLRIHNQFEWADWLPNQDDLAKFFDYYLKDVSNDWPTTPPVRLSLLRFSKTVPDVINRPLTAYPPPNMRLQTFYLSAKQLTVTPTLPSDEATISYPAADNKSEIHFDLTMTSYTELSGFPKLILWMEADGHDDMDIFVLLGRVDKAGKTLRSVNWLHEMPQEQIPLTNVLQHEGPTGILRASHREWMAATPSSSEVIPLPASSSDTQVEPKPNPEEQQWDGRRELYHPHFRSQKLRKGEIVKMEFTTWPIGMVFEAGEILRIRISGRDLCLPETKQIPGAKNQNRGTHILHTGSKYDSCVVLPVLQIEPPTQVTE